MASVLTVTFTVFALIRMRRTFDEPAVRSAPVRVMEVRGRDATTSATRVPEKPASSQPVRAAGLGVADGLSTQAVKPPPKKTRNKAKNPKGEKAYVAALEDEDDVPTTLYRKDDDPDVEALLAEFDNDDGNR